MPDQAKILRKYKPEFLRCRFYNGHAFYMTREIAEEWAGKESTDTAVVSECTSCGTQRTDWLDRTGELVRRRYNYPDGYQIPLEQGDRVDFYAVRREQIRRVVVMRRRK